ncbi:MAG: DNA gyrase inhibitor YacG [Deltaproteobacteria bacterium]|jgi:endogenous inhibitor of DNA gyrase (YacG/DUF329 family)|nr:DNA gyrase inhibitor YacG [Deltaproteobacteria bacterium]
MRCPICKKPTDGSAANRWRPFCCERCRLIDFGRWMGEDYRAPDAPGERVREPRPADRKD